MLSRVRQMGRSTKDKNPFRTDGVNLNGFGGCRFCGSTRQCFRRRIRNEPRVDKFLEYETRRFFEPAIFVYQVVETNSFSRTDPGEGLCDETVEEIGFDSYNFDHPVWTAQPGSEKRVVGAAR
jgi:hypothetical protein